ncbi:MAG: tetratricopeptide repeat protein, partial [Burkholderiaceae bacterium]
MAESSGDTATIARATYWLGYIHYALGDARQALHYSEQAQVQAQAAGDNRLRVQVRATLGQAKAAAAQYEPALQLLDEAIAIKRSHRSGAGQAVGLAYSLATKGAALGDRGEFQLALECFDEARQVVRGARHEVHASIHGLRAAVLLWRGEWEAARESASEACEIGKQVRSIFTLAMGRGAAAYAEWMLRSQPQALEDIRHATDWLQPRGITLFRSFNHGWLADGYA